MDTDLDPHRQTLVISAILILGPGSEGYLVNSCLTRFAYRNTSTRAKVIILL